MTTRPGSHRITPPREHKSIWQWLAGIGILTGFAVLVGYGLYQWANSLPTV